MAATILSRYLDAEVLSRIAGRRIEPRALVLGNLAGAHRSPLSGFAVEFAGHREYVPGDAPKHIDWRIYFRRGKYFIKQYEMETNLVCHLVLDISASMRYGEGDQQKLLYAARLATTLGYAVIRQSDKVSFTTLDDAVRDFLPPSHSLAQVERITERLHQSQAIEKTQLADSLTDVAGRIGRREIVMIFSDLLTDLAALESALQRLRYQQHEVVLFHTLHHDERAFEFDDFTRFVGLESDEQISVQPQDLRQAYLDQLADYLARLAELCSRNRVELVAVDTSRPMAEVLVDYLNHRGGLHRGR